ncbi:unnamed protein product, partial [Gulo gulo]
GRGSLGCLDLVAGWPPLAPRPLPKFSSFPGKPPGICFLLSGLGHLDPDPKSPGDPGVRAPSNSCRTFDQIRAKLLLLLRPPPPFPSSLLLFLKESGVHPKAPHSMPGHSAPWLLASFISWLCFSY